jgi:hypothetical protein
MSYAGLLSFIYAGLSKDDSRHSGNRLVKT